DVAGEVAMALVAGVVHLDLRLQVGGELAAALQLLQGTGDERGDMVFHRGKRRWIKRGAIIPICSGGCQLGCAPGRGDGSSSPRKRGFWRPVSTGDISITRHPREGGDPGPV